MSVSVVIPTFNRAATLDSVLSSYLDEVVQEVIVVDDGGSDQTSSIVEKFSLADERVRYIRLPENRGQAAARNTGIAQCRGEFLFFGEDDAYLAPGALTHALHCAREAGADIVGPRLVYLQLGQTEAEALGVVSARVPVELDTMRFRFNSSVAGAVPALHALMLIRTSVFESVRYDERFSGSAWGEETDFCFAALRAGYHLHFCPESVVFHLPRVQTGGAWERSRWAYERSTISNQLYLLRKHDAFLRSDGYIRRPIWILMTIFITRRVAANLRLLSRASVGEAAYARVVRAIRSFRAG